MRRIIDYDNLENLLVKYQETHADKLTRADVKLIDSVLFEIAEPKDDGWISVKEHLPPKSDEYTDYIVYIIDDEGNWAIGVAEWDCTLGVGTWRLGPDSVALPDGLYITHWMNTPEPPEEYA